MKKFQKISFVLISLILVTLVSIGPIMSRVEIPKYSVVKSIGNIEIREYPKMLQAVVEVSGERNEAIRAGFRLLADYIFGNNIGSGKIAMTAPVQQQSSEKIAMTAPVQQISTNGKWQVSFNMPSEYTMDTIPKPNSKEVKLIEVHKKKFAVIRFAGRNNTKNLNHYECKLLEYIKQEQLEVLSESIYAFYNPPWTLPFLRRNEVMFQVRSL